jgi:hypothetical protein
MSIEDSLFGTTEYRYNTSNRFESVIKLDEIKNIMYNTKKEIIGERYPIPKEEEMSQKLYDSRTNYMIDNKIKENIHKYMILKMRDNYWNKK